MNTAAMVAISETGECPPALPPAISFTGVTKRYGDTLALDGVSFAIQPGQMVALLGPNGAGKSTTVDVMLGLRRPDSGAVHVLGRSPAQATAQGRVGAMLQTGGLPAHATVGEVVELARRLYGGRRGLGELLRSAGLSGLDGRRVQQLSGGQAQRVRLAVALSGAPEVLFLDEPTVGLDPGARRDFWDTVRAAADRGATVLFSTHYLEEADVSADRILVLAKGRLVADGPPAAIKAELTGRTISATLSQVGMDRLHRLRGITAINVRGEQVTLRTSDPDATLADLYGSGLRVTNLHISGASLEDALLSLTAPAGA